MIKEHDLEEVFQGYDIFGNDLGNLETLPKLHGHDMHKLNLRRLYIPRLSENSQSCEEREAQTNTMLRKFTVKGTDLFVSNMSQIFSGEVSVVAPEDLRFEFSINGSIKYLDTYYNVRFLYSIGNISQDLQFTGVSLVAHNKSENYSRAQLDKLKSYLLNEDNIDMDLHYKPIKFI